MKKSLRFKNAATQNINLFKCPICGLDFSIRDLTFFCPSNHTFDISNKGYVNFVSNYKPSSYDKELFAGRKKAAAAGFFDELNAAVLKLIPEYKANGYILDAGCGEGSGLNYITSRLENFYGIGIDISKDGVMQSEQTEKSIFVVGDIANIPVRDKSIDIILNILTPANYVEFSRVLQKGVLIKIIPNPNYLKELRCLFYTDTSKKDYFNNKAVEHFHKHFNSVREIDCNYEFSANEELLTNILHMTPLLWNFDNKFEKISNTDIDSITCDFKILVGKND